MSASPRAQAAGGAGAERAHGRRRGGGARGGGREGEGGRGKRRGEGKREKGKRKKDQEQAWEATEIADGLLVASDSSAGPQHAQRIVAG